MNNTFFKCGLIGCTTGWLLRKFEMCPWDYSDADLNVDGLIRLDYGPWWFVMGLIFERCVCCDKKDEV